MSEFLRITGRPKIERDSSGLRKITRTYIVQGEVVTEDRVEEEVFLPYGTPDLEYHAAIEQDLSNGGLTNSEVTGAYLVAQSIDPGSNVNEAILTRVYQELDASSEPVQVGQEEITRGASDRLTVKKTFIVKNPYSEHYISGRVGIDSITVEGSECFLGTVQSNESEVFTEFVEVYYEDGVLSESINYKYGQYPNHKLEVRTYRSIDNIEPPSDDEGPENGTWFLVSSKEGPGDDNFGQMGKTIKTSIYAKGYGLISKDEQVKGKEPRRVFISTVKFITAEDGEIPASDIPDFTRKTFEGKEEQDGYELHTIRGVTLEGDSGVVEVSVDYKHGKRPSHKLEVARVVSYGATATSEDVLNFVYPSGDTTDLGDYVLIAEKENTQGEFDVYTSEFARGSGEISRTEKTVGLTSVTEVISLHPPLPLLSSTKQEGELVRKVEILDGYQRLTIESTLDESGVVDSRLETKNNGKLLIKTLTQLGDSWDESNSPGSYVEVSVRDHRFDRYPAITKVFAKGEGEISSSVRKVGISTVKETVTLYKDTDVISDEITGDTLSITIEQLDGYQKVTESSTEGSGVVDSKTETKNNGKLIIQSITLLGDSWDNNQSPSNYAPISDRRHTYQGLPAITKVFAKGEGEVSESKKKIGKASVTERVTLAQQNTSSGDISLKDGEISKRVEQLDGYEKITIVSRDLDDSGIIDSKTETRNNGALSIVTITQLGSSWDETNSPKQHAEISTRNHERQDLPCVTKVFAQGDGLIQESVSEGDLFKTTSFVYISKEGSSFNFPSEAVDTDTRQENGYQINSYKLKEPYSGRPDNTKQRYSNGLIIDEVSNLNKEFTTPDSLLSNEKRYIDSKNYISTQESAVSGNFINKSINISSGVRTTRDQKIESTVKTDFSNGGSTEQIASKLFRNTNVTIEAAGLAKTSINVSGGVITTSTTSVGSESNYNTNNEGGSTEEIAPGIYRNTDIEKTAASTGGTSTSISGGLITTRTTSVGESSDFGNEGSFEQLANNIYRTVKVTKQPSSLSGRSVTVSGGVMRETTSGVQEGAPTIPSDGGSFEQIAENIYRFSTVTESAGAFSSTSTSISGGVRTERSTNVGTSSGFSTDEGSSEQIGNSVFRNTTITKTAAGFSGKSVSVSGGVIRTTESGVQSGAPDIPDDGGSFEQIANDIFRFSKVTEEAGAFTSTRTSISGGVRTVSSTDVSDSSGFDSDEGSSEQIGNSVFRNTTITKTAAGLGGESISISGGVRTTRTTGVGEDSNFGNEGSFEELAAGIYRTVKVSKEAAGFSSKSVNISNGVRTEVTGSVGEDTTIGNDGGSFEQIADGIYRTSKITKSAASLNSTRISVSGGVQTTTTVSIGGSQAPDSTNGGGSEQLASNIFKNTTIEYSQAPFTSTSVNISGGVKTERTTTVGSESGFSTDQGSSEQLAPGIFRKTTVTESSAGFINKSVNYSGGLRTETTESIGGSSKDPGEDGGGYQQLASDVYRNREVTVSAGSFSSKKISKSKYYTETTTGGVGDSSDFGDEGSYEQIANNIYRTSEVTRVSNTFSDVFTTASNGGAVKVTKTDTVNGNGGDFGGVSTIDEDITLGTTIDYSAGEYTSKRKYVDSNGFTITETKQSVSSIPESIEEGDSYDQVAPGVWIYTQVSVDEDEDDDDTILDRTYYQEGVKFNEKIAYSPPSVEGTIVDESTENVVVAGIKKTKYRKVGASVVETEYTLNGSTTFTIPGFVKWSRLKGFSSSPPQEIEAATREEVKIGESPWDVSYFYKRPSASISAVVEFFDGEQYDAEGGGHDYVLRQTTSGNISQGQVFMGKTVFETNVEKTGTQLSEWQAHATRPLRVKTDVIYSKNGLTVYKSRKIFLQVVPSVPNG